MALLKRKRAGLNDAMSVVTRFVNACNRHDADGVGACLHPDFDSIQPMYPSRNFRGADQVRRNWQAIFDAEPGFRLTVLRSAAMDDTVWVELHGAGREAEVAGVFVMGIQGDRIRWARIYSALVEPVPAGVGDDAAPAPLQGVPPLREPGDGEVFEESLIAPVLDMDRSSRRRRRRRGSEEEEAVAASTDDGAQSEPEPEEAGGAEAGTGTPIVTQEPEPEPSGVDVEVVEMVEIEPEVVVVVEEDADVAPVAEAVVAGTDAQPAGDVADAVADDAVADDGSPAEAVEMTALTDPEPGPLFETDAPAPEPPKRRFGKRSRP